MHRDFALILIFLGVAVPLLGRRRVRQLMAMPHTTKALRLRLYASTIAFQWIAAAIIFWRAQSHSLSFAQLGVAVPNVRLSVVVAALLSGLIFLNQTFSLRRISQHPGQLRGVLPHLALKIFPQDSPERLAFAALVCSVAICEEFIYRGFALRVFDSVAHGSAAAAVLGSAALFALAHLYQGRWGLLATCVVGILFGSICVWTASLLPSVVAHFVADLSAGFMAPARIKSALAATTSDGPAASA
jgi:membrane protease YdiL (CAAX protease family)